jgi:hypothetical protein
MSGIIDRTIPPSFVSIMELDLFGQRISPEVSSKPSNGPQFAKVDEAPMMSRATSQKELGRPLRGIESFIKEGNLTTVWNEPCKR